MGHLHLPFQVVRAFGAVSLCSAAVFLYNTTFVPAMRRAFEFSSDIAALVSIIVFCALALIAYYRPSDVRFNLFVVVAAMLAVAGIPLVYVGFQTMQPLALVAGSMLFYVGTDCGFIVALMSCCEVPEGKRIAVSIGAVAMGYALSLAVSHLPLFGIVAAALLMPLASLVLSWTVGRRAFAVINQSEPAATTRIASPRAMLPFSHLLFLVLLLIQFVFGYSVTVKQDALAGFWPLILLVVLLVGVVCLRKCTLDDLFRMVLLLALTGLVALGQAVLLPPEVASAILGSVNGIYLAFLCATLSTVASRNLATSLTVFAWGWSLSEIGIVLGANLAVWTPAVLQPCCTFVLMAALLVLVLFGLRRFNVDDAVAGVVAPMAANRVASTGELEEGSSLERKCALAAKRFGLTPRETEVVGLLAQGRNGVRIQETLVITRNTYKTHIRHIYEKMNVHDQQEVMDVVQGL